jgi:hypothetical protein
VAQLLSIADAMVDLINAGLFSQTFIATRQYLPIERLEVLNDLTVTVVCRGFNSNASTRAMRQLDYSVDIGVQQRYPIGNQDVPDSLTDLMEEIGDYLWNNPLANISVRIVDLQNVPIYLPQHIEEFSQFTSVLRPTYRAWR